MLAKRIIPCLLLKGSGFVKTRKFQAPVYLGDPINIVKIFNDKFVDEIIILDIGASPSGRGPNFELLKDIATECFMPLAYGGGITSMDHMNRLFQIGFEKICLNSAAITNPEIVSDAARRFGSQSIIVSIDVKRKMFGGFELLGMGGSSRTGLDLDEFAIRMERLGAGEIFLNSVDRDGMMDGYDLALIQRVASAVSIPVIACGGAGSALDFAQAINAGASAVSAGSLFVFRGPHRAVLVNVPSKEEIQKAFSERYIVK